MEPQPNSITQVRSADFGDFEAMLELAHRGHAASENARYKFDAQAAIILAGQCILEDSLCAFVATSDKEVVGLLLGQEQKYPYLKMRYATDLVLYAEHPGAGRSLVERFKRWAFDERKVDQVLMGVSYGGHKANVVSRMYERMGFREVGGMHVLNRE